MPNQEPTDRQERYKQKMNDVGIVRINVWVPEEDRERLKKYAERLRREYVKENAIES